MRVTDPRRPHPEQMIEALDRLGEHLTVGEEFGKPLAARWDGDAARPWSGR